MSRHLRWEAFDERIQAGPPSVEPIKGSPEIRLFIDPHGVRVGIWVPTEPRTLPSSPLAEVSISHIREGDLVLVEVATTNRSLYRDFYSFCCAVADRVQVDGRPVEDAVRDTLAAWSSLLQRRALLTEDKQIGLMGELLFLLRVGDALGWDAAVRMWQGPGSEEHDFTLPGVDVEVKTCRTEERIHQVGSLRQLLPKEGRPLCLVSVQLTSGGSEPGSHSLPELVTRVLAAASRVSQPSADRLRRLLGQLGWDDADAGLYESRWRLRAPLLAVPVDEAFPAIVPETLAPLGEKRLARIRRVSYAVVVDGLGVLEDGGTFRRLLFQK